jgi:plasmid maintenance system killer protein
MEPIPIRVNPQDINQPAFTAYSFPSHHNPFVPSAYAPRFQESSPQVENCETTSGNLKGFHFKSKDLENLYRFRKGQQHYPEAVVKKFLKALEMIASAKSGQDLYNLRSLKFHKLKGSAEHSIWLTGNWRLITEFEEAEGGRHLLILRIEDYH